MAKKKSRGFFSGIAPSDLGDRFRHLVSPLGHDGAETPLYSPDGEVGHELAEGPHEPPEPKEYRKNERRGG